MRQYFPLWIWTPFVCNSPNRLSTGS